MWGTWWEWDARLTSFLVLLIIYLGLIALWHAIEEPAKSARMAAVVVLVGALNIPIIRFSVEWFTTLHQGTQCCPLWWSGAGARISVSAAGHGAGLFIGLFDAAFDGNAQ